MNFFIKHDCKPSSFLRKSGSWLYLFFKGMFFYLFFSFSRRKLLKIFITKRKIIAFYRKINVDYCMTLYGRDYKKTALLVADHFLGYKFVSDICLLSFCFKEIRDFSVDKLDSILPSIMLSDAVDDGETNKVLQHGDLVPSNIMKCRDDFFVIDGDHVGYHPKGLDLVCLCIALAAGEPFDINEYNLAETNPYLIYLFSFFGGISVQSSKKIRKLIEYKIAIHAESDIDVAEIWRRYLCSFNSIFFTHKIPSITCISESLLLVENKLSMVGSIITWLLALGYKVRYVHSGSHEPDKSELNLIVHDNFCYDTEISRKRNFPEKYDFFIVDSRYSLGYIPNNALSKVAFFEDKAFSIKNFYHAIFDKHLAYTSRFNCLFKFLQQYCSDKHLYLPIGKVIFPSDLEARIAKRLMKVSAFSLRGESFQAKAILTDRNETRLNIIFYADQYERLKVLDFLQRFLSPYVDRPASELKVYLYTNRKFSHNELSDYGAAVELRTLEQDPTNLFFLSDRVAYLFYNSQDKWFLFFAEHKIPMAKLVNKDFVATTQNKITLNSPDRWLEKSLSLLGSEDERKLPKMEVDKDWMIQMNRLIRYLISVNF